jgi:hypothetical protein
VRHGYKRLSGGRDTSGAQPQFVWLKIGGAGSVLSRRNKVSRWLVYVTAFLLLWSFARRLAVRPSTLSILPVAHSAPGGVMPIGTPAHRKRRAALPPGVVMRTGREHPVDRGLLKVDMRSKVHPIYQLIRDAREAWDTKLAKQSRSLQEAVETYRRRYSRPPPKGFDRWWKYVV